MKQALAFLLVLFSATAAGAIPAPSGLKAAPGDGFVELSWSGESAPDFNRFIVFYGLSHAEYTLQKETANNSIKISGLENGKAYFFAVLAVDSKQNFSEYSEETIAVPGTPPKPLPPIGLRASLEEETGVIEWAQPSPPPVKYIIFKRTAGEGEFREIGQAKSTFWYDENIERGNSYQYVAVSVDKADNKSDYSNVAVLEFPAASKECNPAKDGICDPDCERKQDPDCNCNRDGKCEEEFESQPNCPEDCWEAIQGASFFDYFEGIGLLAFSFMLLFYFFEAQ